MHVPKILKNKSMQFASTTVGVFFILASTAGAYTICINAPGACTLKSSDRPSLDSVYNHIQGMAEVKCVNTSRVAVVLSTQKKNSIGSWVTVESVSKGGTSSAYAEIDTHCTNTKLTTWRTHVKVVGNFGAWTYEKSSINTLSAYCGT